jgi:uncharacterized membrane protein YidH (DUF202 family)
MNRKKIATTSKQTQLLAVTIVAASIVAAAMIIGINNSQNLQKAMAQEVDYPSGINTTAAKEEANEYKTIAANSSSTTESVNQLTKNSG